MRRHSLVGRLRTPCAALRGAVLVLVLGAAACGGSSGAGSSGGKDGTGAGRRADPRQAGLDFARCMRERGVDMPDPDAVSGALLGPAPGSPLPAAFDAAEKACRHFLQALVGGAGAGVDPEEQDRGLKFARCMRGRGVDMPDPDFTTGGPPIDFGGGTNPATETFGAAMKACSPLLGAGGGARP